VASLHPKDLKKVILICKGEGKRKRMYFGDLILKRMKTAIFAN
jgi:hypothetical protein